MTTDDDALDLSFLLARAYVGPVTEEQKTKIRAWEVEYVLREILDLADQKPLPEPALVQALYTYANMTRRTWESRRRYAAVYSDFSLDLRTDTERQRDDLRRKIAKLRQINGRTPEEQETALVLIERLESRLAKVGG